MSTARKVLLIIATALVVAGITLAGTAFALAGGDLRNLSTDQRHWEQGAYEIPADQVAALSTISVSDSEDISIEGYEGDTIRIEYWENEQRGVLIELTLPGAESDYALDAAAENGTVYGPPSSRATPTAT